MVQYQALYFKGYTGKVEFDDAADIFHGEVIGLRDVITFRGRTVDEVKEAFQESVDDYLAFCAKRGEEPEKPFTGKFVVRTPPDLHRKVYVAAKKSGASMNSWILQTLEHSTEHLSNRLEALPLFSGERASVPSLERTT